MRASGMLDARRLELEHLALLLHDGEKCLEVGCGDGAGSLEISRARSLDLLSVDRSAHLIRLARRRPVSGIAGRIAFAQGDVLELRYREAFDVVFTGKCLTCLRVWRDQKLALVKLAQALRRGGRLILLEAFADGLTTLNTARDEVGLQRISPGGHTLPLDRDKVRSALADCCAHLIGEHNFLSSYAFGSRVLYPALARAGRRQVRENAAFGHYFSLLPPLGNYSDTKILVFQRGA